MVSSVSGASAGPTPHPVPQPPPTPPTSGSGSGGATPTSGPTPAPSGYPASNGGSEAIDVLSGYAGAVAGGLFAGPLGAVAGGFVSAAITESVSIEQPPPGTLSYNFWDPTSQEYINVDISNLNQDNEGYNVTGQDQGDGTFLVTIVPN